MSPPGARGRHEVVVRLAGGEAERDAHFRVRHAVFVEEQGIFTGTDRDEHDDDALHAVALAGPLVVGAVRLRPLDEPGLWQGDRLAVLPEARRLRAGAPLVRFAVRTAAERGGALMVAEVQVPNVAFFLHLGWERVGEPHEHRRIAHQRMRIPLAVADQERAAGP
ncbi:MAG: GNAT family N-acetyltransferase [Thermoleophilia bacterium]|jgi:putative N-acetyltransferase (TIGR04045 family)|nr:GNAT family N-acetyltransferase [Thermoleophilia bacterium]